MTYAVVSGATVVQYPADPQGDNPGTSFAPGWENGTINGKTYVTVEPSPQPPYDDTTQIVAETEPKEFGGVWVQQWEVIDLDPAQIEANLVSAQNYRISSINAEAYQRITAEWPIWAQSNVSMGVYSEPSNLDCKNWVASNVEASNEASDEIRLQTTIDGVNSVVVTWPTYTGSPVSHKFNELLFDAKKTAKATAVAELAANPSTPAQFRALFKSIMTAMGIRQ